MANTRKKIFIIAGESSGDLLGSRIMGALQHNNKDVKIDFVGIGGEKMKKHGLNSIFPMSDLSLMGFFEILPKVFHLLKRIKQTIKTIIDEKPDLILTIDSPDFSFKVMKGLKSKDKKLFKNTKKVHLIAPSVWAYREKRAKKIARLYDLLLCILPFEPPYFEKYGLKTEFIGHPIFDIERNTEKYQKEELQKKYSIDPDNPILILTPGSRETEVDRIYPIMIKSINLLKEEYKYRNATIFTFANSSTQYLVDFISHDSRFDTKIIIDEEEKQKIMPLANVVLAKSGTNTFEFNIAGVPMVITYTFNWLTNKIAKKLVKIRFANLVNILADREVIPEFVLDNAKPELIVEGLKNILDDKDIAEKQVKESKNIIKTLGYNSDIKSSEVCAEKILNLLIKGDNNEKNNN